MSISLRELADLVARVAPPETADEWDNVGLQTGDPDAPVRRALVALEPSDETLDEAERMGAEAIVSHHPLIFQPIRNVVAEGRTGRIVTRLVQSGIGLVVAHTNLDRSPAGPNHALARALGVEIERWLLPQPQQDQVKLVVFTPAGHERKIIDAIAQGGGGRIGAYSHCSFRAPGMGTFFPLEGAKPFLGQKGRFEEAQETRLESVVPKRCLAEVLRRVLAAHPYEEPAYDIYPLEPGAAKAGLGLVGQLRKLVTLARLAARAHSALRPLLPEAARAAWKRPGPIGDKDRPIECVAICSGSGGSLAPNAARAGADCLVTGEIGYHDAVEARSLGLAVLPLGHFASEAAGIGHFAAALAAEADRSLGRRPRARRAIEFLIARSETDPIPA